MMALALVVSWRVMDGMDRPPAVENIDSIAVLPFSNLTGDASQDYLADGVTEILIGNLAQLRSIRVISRTSTMANKGTRKPLAEIAKELNVNGIIEGSVARSGDRLRVSVQLLRADERHVWGQTYERPTADLFRVRGDLEHGGRRDQAVPHAGRAQEPRRGAGRAGPGPGRVSPGLQRLTTCSP